MTKQLSFKLFKLIGLIFLIFIGLFVYFNSDEHEKSYKTKAYSSSQDLRLFRNRTAAPQLTWTSEGNKVAKLSEYSGKVVYFNFWAQWCPPCLEEMKSLDNLYLSLKNQNIELIFVNMDENSDGLLKAKEHYNNNQLHAPAVYSQNTAFSSKILLQILPYHLIIDRNGQVAAEFFGDIIGKEEQLKVMLQQLLSESPAYASKK